MATGQTSQLCGMDARTGRALTGAAWLSQAAASVLFTPRGSRLMRRDTVGSIVFELVDQPDNPVTTVRLYAATAEALAQQLPQLELARVQLSRPRAGQLLIDLEGQEADTGNPLAFSVDASGLMTGAAA